MGGAARETGSPFRGTPVGEAVVRLTDDLRGALASREPVILKYPAGVGKSHAAATVIAEAVRAGERVIYATQEHVVAHETRSKLPPDVLARSVHLHSPLLVVAGSARCARTAELQERVFEFGTSLMGQVCPRCPQREGCEALEEARGRYRGRDDAQAIFVSHAGIQQALDDDGEARLIVDEMPSVYTQLLVTRDQLRALARGVPLPVDALIGRLVQEVARAWLDARAPGRIAFGANDVGLVVELLDTYNRVRLRDGAYVQPELSGLLKAADAVLRMGAEHYLKGTRLSGFGGTGDIWMMAPDVCHKALLERGGVLLSATPMLQAMPGFRVVEAIVSDGAPVRRVMVLRSGRGSGAMLKSYFDLEKGVRVRREPVPGEGPGVPWPVVDAALARARKEAARYELKRVLFVTFKALADALRAQPWRIGDDIEIGHFGALRGKNDWMEGRDREVSVVYCLGAFRGDLEPTLAALGLFGDNKMDAWTDAAAGELTQAEGRLRLPRRTKPCTVVVEGDVAPSSWTADNIDECVPEGCDEETDSARAESLLSLGDDVPYDPQTGEVKAVLPTPRALWDWGFIWRMPNLKLRRFLDGLTPYESSVS